jgi:hypothetical protein
MDSLNLSRKNVNVRAGAASRTKNQCEADVSMRHISPELQMLAGKATIPS